MALHDVSQTPSVYKNYWVEDSPKVITGTTKLSGVNASCFVRLRNHLFDEVDAIASASNGSYSFIKLAAGKYSLIVESIDGSKRSKVEHLILL